LRAAQRPGATTSQVLACEAERTTIQASVAAWHAVRFSPARRHEEATGMLRITRLASKGRLMLKLEGQLLEPWVSTVRDACTQSGQRSGPVCLDLAAVNYVDAAGVCFLCDLMRRPHS